MVALFACKDEQTQQETWISANEKPLTPEVEAVFDAAIDAYLSIPEGDIAQSPDTGTTADDGFLTREKYEKTTFTRLPLYTFDVEKFMENPSEGEVLSCIHPAQNNMLFAGRRDGKMVMTINLQLRDEEWSVGTLGIDHEESFARNYCDLPQLAAQTDDQRYNFLEFMHQTYLFYKIDGEMYFSVLPNSERWTPAQFAEMAREAYKYYLQCKEDMEELQRATTRPSD